MRVEDQHASGGINIRVEDQHMNREDLCQHSPDRKSSAGVEDQHMNREDYNESGFIRRDFV